MGLFNSLKKKNQVDDSSLQKKEEISTEIPENEEELLNEKVIKREVKQKHVEEAVNKQNSIKKEEPKQKAPSKATVVKEKPKTNVSIPKIEGNNKILTVINQKGGVGKSTTAINLGCALAERGKKVLVIDLDPQGNTTSGLGIEKKNLNQCVYDVLLKDITIDDISVKDAYKNVDVAPATINLAGAEVELVNEIARENRLKSAIDKVKDKYDYVFIDCPPSLGLLTVNALVAADKLLIPIQTEFYALEGVTKLLDSMKLVKSHLNPNLDIFGVLLTMYDGRTTLAKQVADEVRKYFKDLVFETMIPRTVKISEAPSFGQPITQYEPDSKGAIAYKNLAKEVVNRG